MTRTQLTAIKGKQMNNRERKKKAAEEHNQRYNAEKERLSKMSEDEILRERITRSISKASSELTPQAKGMVTKQP